MLYVIMNAVRDWSVIRRVVAVAILATMSFSLGVPPVMAEEEVPGAPTDLRAVSAAKGMRLTWSAPADGGDVTGYQVLRRRPEQGESKLTVFSSNTGSVATEWTDTSVEEGVRYVYRVKGLNSAGASGPVSNFANVRYQAPGVGAPHGLTAVSAAKGMRLAWSAPADGGDVTGYQVLRRRPEQGEKKLTVFSSNTGSVATEWTDTSVEEGVRYVYRVKGLNSAGASGPVSNFANVRYVDPVPGAPTAATSVSVVAGVHISWTAPEGDIITGYRVLRRRPDHNENELLVLQSDTGTKGTEWVDRNVTSGDTYVYGIRAINGQHVGALSNETRLTYVSPLPAAPLHLDNENLVGGVGLSWKPPLRGPVMRYRVERRVNSAGDWSVVMNGPSEQAPSTVWTDVDVVEGTRYEYRVSAANSHGVGAHSNQTSGTYKSPLPSAPTDLAVENTASGIEISWSKPDWGDITSYAVLRREQNENDMSVHQEGIAGSVTEWTDGSVTAGTTYVYMVRAVNVHGNGPSSETATIEHEEVPASSIATVAVSGHRDIYEYTTNELEYRVSGLNRDNDPETVELNMRADVQDSNGANADSCEQTGMGISQTITVVDQDVETLTVVYGNTSADCGVGDYQVVAVFRNGDGSLIKTMRVHFAVMGPDSAEVEVD